MFLKNIRLAIYDWNGTLLDDIHTAYGSVCHIFKMVAPDVPPPSLDEYRNEITSDFMNFYWAHGMPRTFTGDMFNAIRTPWYEQHSGSIALNKGARELLSVCKTLGMKNAIVSASPEDIEPYLDRYNVRDLFDKIRIRAWPKDGAFRETLDFFGIAPSEAFYLDDTFDGLRIAKKFGLRTIGFTGGYNSRTRMEAAQPDKIVDSLSEVTRLLQEKV